MTTTIDSLHPCFDVEAMPDYEGISQRFQEGFTTFVTTKMLQAADTVLKDEIQHETLVKNPDFVQAIARRIDEEALLEKRYIFISVNPQALV